MPKINTKKVVFDIDGKSFQVDLPKELSLRENQNPMCNKNGHLCALFRNQLCCLEVKPEQDGNHLSLFEMRACSKNPSKKIRIEG